VNPATPRLVRTYNKCVPCLGTPPIRDQEFLPKSNACCPGPQGLLDFGREAGDGFGLQQEVIGIAVIYRCAAGELTYMNLGFIGL
jgi:hypothetical protein